MILCFFGKLHHKPERCQDVLLGLTATLQLADERLDVEAGDGINRAVSKTGQHMPVHHLTVIEKGRLFDSGFHDFNGSSRPIRPVWFFLFLSLSFIMQKRRFASRFGGNNEIR
jgi:hypothetical protein